MLEFSSLEGYTLTCDICGAQEVFPPRTRIGELRKWLIDEAGNSDACPACRNSSLPETHGHG